MGIVHLTVARVKTRAETSATIPLIDAVTEMSRTITSTGSSVVTAIPPVGRAFLEGLVLSVTTSTNLFVTIGGPDDPLAGADNGHLIIAGTTRDFAWNGATKIAVKEA